MKVILFFFIAISSSFAINCGDFTGEFKTYGGHYYAVTGNKMSFENAKNFASANGGYLAIPNSSGENTFIKSLIGGNNEAWIGIYDPNYTQSLCFTANCFSTNRTRFKTVKNQTLSYQNWDSIDVENQFLEGDDAIDMYGKPVINLLGEHWTLMSGNTGKWRDWGTHFMSGENPATERAILEFDTKPICYNEPSTVTDEITGRVCNSQVWDSVIGVSEGTTAQCLSDVNNVEYCPQSLAECGQSWDYEDGYSVGAIGTAIDYLLKEKQYKCPSNNYLLSSRYYDSCSGCIDQTYYEVRCSTDGSVTVTHEFRLKSNNSYNGGRLTATYNQDNIGNNVSNIYLGNIGQGCNYLVYYSKTCDGVNCNYNYRVNSNCNGSSYSTVNTAPIPYAYVCPIGYFDNGSNCKKNVNYTYYNYICSAGYTATNAGGNTGKTDPNTSTDNTSTLDDPLNSSTPPTNNCKKEKFTCLANESRPCAYVDGKHQCSPFPCVGESDFERLGTVEGANDKNNAGWNNDGECSGTIHIFNGKDHRCRVEDKFFGLIGGGCCDKDKVFFGLIACKENEKMLAKKRQNDLCHYVGNYCSKKLKFIGCIQTSESHCCFNSKLARIIHEQGRPQIGLSWGSGDSPNCRGFKPEEFQKLDMSKMNLSEAFEDITISTANISTLTTHIQNKVNDINVTMSR